jgi:DNA polymerase-3 subunit epsilon
VDALVATAETVRPAGAVPSEERPATRIRPLLEATAEEMECALRWMAQPGTRLVEVEGEWVYPVHGAEAVLAARPELRHDRERRLPVQ